MDEKDKSDLVAALLQATPEQLDQIHEGLVQIRTDQENLNSAFPATRAFLHARGLTNIRELDAKGKQELVEHLMGVLEKIPKAKA